MSSSRRSCDETAALATAGSTLPSHLQYVADATDALVDFTWERLDASRVRPPVHTAWMRCALTGNASERQKERREIHSAKKKVSARTMPC